VVTAVIGYLGGNWFLTREGVGLAVGDDGVLRALVGSGLYLAVLGLFGAALGLLLRSTAGAVTLGIASSSWLATSSCWCPGRSVTG
jgi:ABC-2 type transport system permease protein